MILTICGAAMSWTPFLLAVLGYDRLVGFYFPNIGLLLYAGLACLFVVVLPLSIVSLMRHDYVVGAFGLTVVFSSGFMIWGFTP